MSNSRRSNTKRTTLPLLFLLVAACLSACGSDESAESYRTLAEQNASPRATTERDVDFGFYATDASAEVQPASRSSRSEASPDIAFVSSTSAAYQRKIIFTASIELIVDEFEGVTKSVGALAKRHGGFVSKSHLVGSEGEPRRGDWTLRIPSQNLDAFVDASKALGQVRSHRQDSEEVTAEYIDLESRIRNLTAEEARLLKHLDESTRSLKDILNVEREISRVRGEIERAQGRRNVLTNLTSLATVTLTVQEIKDYIPQPTEEPSFATQVARTWHASIGGVGSFVTTLSLGIVGVVPWLTVVLPTVLLAWIALRRMRTHRTAAFFEATQAEAHDATTTNPSA